MSCLQATGSDWLSLFYSSCLWKKISTDWLKHILYILSFLISDSKNSYQCRFPFYFELKIAFVIWLLSPYTKGSSVLYRKFVHPTLSNKERVRVRT